MNRQRSAFGRCGRRSQRGITLVELMVAMALGLFVVAVTLMLTLGQLRESRALLQEARLTHDLHAAVDLVARDLRRAGYWGAAERSATGVANPYANLSLAAGEIGFAFSRDAAENGLVDADDRFGFRLRNAALQMQLGEGNWQPVTDEQALRIERFVLTPAVDDLPLGSACVKPCPPTDASCPKQQIRRVVIEVTARSTTDAQVVRSVRQDVRLRNDALAGVCPV